MVSSKMILAQCKYDHFSMNNSNCSLCCSYLEHNVNHKHKSFGLRSHTQYQVFKTNLDS